METTREQLLRMMQQYDIGKKPLSKLLGWGETTVLRYLGGTEPNPEFAERISYLADHPRGYLELLAQGKERITATAYEKTRRAAYRLVFCDRSAEAAQYVVNLAGGDIAPGRVVAVLYYAQVASLVNRGQPIFEEEACLAAGEQPPYPRLYEALLSDGMRPLFPEETALGAEEEAYLAETYQILNGYSPNAIRVVLKRDKKSLGTGGRAPEGAVLGAAQLGKRYGELLQRAGLGEKMDVRQYFSYCLTSQRTGASV